MKAFDSSSLWRISQFRKARNEGRLDLEHGGDRPTLLPTTLLADLRRLQSEGADGDVLEVIAACVRNHDAALLYLELGEFVWPVTLFPREGLYHSPRDALSMAASLALVGAAPSDRRAARGPPARPCDARAGRGPRQVPAADRTCSGPLHCTGRGRWC